MKKDIYFGTYTKGHSKGIYKAQFDQSNGHLSDLENIIEIDSPTYLVTSQKGNLYAIRKEGNQGGIAAFDAEGKFINSVLLDGAPLCHLAIDEKRQLLYGANYHKGEIIAYQIEENGAIKLADLVTLQGSGPHQNQKSAHAHYVGLSPDKYLITCDLGSDKVRSFAISEQGKLELITEYQSIPGAGPRHLVFHPNQKIAYLLCELNSTVEVLIYNGCGYFERLQTISTLPDDFTDFNATAAIRISPDGKFLYASNRGHDSIAVFAVDKDAQLSLREIVPCQGKNPRDFNLSPDQNYLIVGHQDSNNATVFKRDAESGQLSLISKDFYLPEAVCIYFPE
ncbi:carboxy-cis,cis-muconate cyclase [Streptococcus penaeicida]|uniref:Carboxy-cis,cis-muconate cyclase n=1 Tax=Streptococcus penaeicida TaxID=1765960 RepID=A0A2N8LCD8_9STRE|nr:lactonase family protein [Streptococcus penaeicida]PND47816.1 carboxy-cis,cis-muconate cyclase [Streptococcus penaeicida]